jgi:4-hydroxybenzoate polyprenyltransferase
MNLSFLLKVSRYRFWFYTFGPYIIGIVAAAERPGPIIDVWTVIYGIYFLFPANLLIYGVNDIFDYETDVLNNKKQGYEPLVSRDKHRELWFAIACTNIPFIVCAIFLGAAIIPLIGFLLFSIFYSAKPVRAKAVPFLDSAFNILYVFPAIFGYMLHSGELPPAILIAAAACWTAAMHAYSAVPDIDADSEAGVSTIATVLGKKLTLVVCAFLYAISAALAFKWLGFIAVLLGFIYLSLMLISIFLSKRLFQIYKMFPIVNIAAGAALFWYVALTRFF